MPPINFTAAAIKSNARPICIIEFCKPLMFNFLALPSRSTDAEDNLSIAIDRATRTAASTAITPTAFQSFAGSSIVVRTQIAATNMAIAIAIFCMAWAFKSQATPLRTLLKLFNAFPAPEKRSPTPSKTPAIELNASASCFRTQTMETIAPPANSLPHSMFPLSSVIKSQKLLNTSTIFSPMVLRTVITSPILSLIAFIAPWKKSQTISYAFHEGE